MPQRIIDKFGDFMNESAKTSNVDKMLNFFKTHQEIRTIIEDNRNVSILSVIKTLLECDTNDVLRDRENVDIIYDIFPRYNTVYWTMNNIKTKYNDINKLAPNDDKLSLFIGNVGKNTDPSNMIIKYEPDSKKFILNGEQTLRIQSGSPVIAPGYFTDHLNAESYSQLFKLLSNLP